MTQESAALSASAAPFDAAPPVTAPVTTTPAGPSIFAKMGAEVLGTFILVFVGVGAALYSGILGLGQIGVALAFGIALIAGISAVGHVSGGHFNPAVTMGMALAGRTPWRDLPLYWAAQIVGAIAASSLLRFTVPSTTSLKASTGFNASSAKDFFLGASNGYGVHSPAYTAPKAALFNYYQGQGIAATEINSAITSKQLTVPQGLKFELGASFALEAFAVAVFVGVILAVTDKRTTIKFQAITIGLTLAAMVLIVMPVTNSSINPARSIATAIFAGGWAWSQLWVFIVAPLVGGAIAALFYRGFALAAPRLAKVGVGAPMAPSAGFSESIDAETAVAPELAGANAAQTEADEMAETDVAEADSDITETDGAEPEVAEPESDAVTLDEADEAKKD